MNPNLCAAEAKAARLEVKLNKEFEDHGSLCARATTTDLTQTGVVLCHFFDHQRADVKDSD